MVAELADRRAKTEQDPAGERRERDAEHADAEPQPAWLALRANENRDSADEGDRARRQREAPVESIDPGIALQSGEEGHPGENRTNGDERAARDCCQATGPVTPRLAHAAPACARAHVLGRTLKKR